LSCFTYFSINQFYILSNQLINKERKEEDRDGGGTVKILGAGIAGLTAAINLAEAGFHVTVYEKAPSVGNRFCNDFQGLENWSDEKDALELLEGLSIETNFWNRGVNEVLVYTDFKKEFVVRGKQSLFYLVERGPENSLEENLKNQALNAGAKIIFNSNVSEGDCDIIATGPVGRKPFAIAKGIVFDTNAEDSATLVLNDKLAFKGYSYLLVAGGKATLASVVCGDFSRANNCFESTLRVLRKRRKLRIRNPRSFGGYGAFALNKSNSHNGKLFVGEAAGFQDFLLGFGMKHAFISGWLAAKSLIEGVDFEREWKRLLAGKMKASVSNRLLLELFGMRGYNYLVSQAANSKEPREWLRRFYACGFGKRLLFPFAGLKLWRLRKGRKGA
jgi:flavin-dependent dehydrogenase